jgi:WD40 repeat protein
LVVGCGQAASEPEPTPPQATAATVSGEAPTSVPTATPQQRRTAPVATAAPTKQPAIAAPTPEQITRWTPAPFEPLQLLAIREWDKTSFTHCLAAMPDGKHFIAAGSRVLLWSINGDEPEHVFLELDADDDDDREILSLAVAPDGKWFAVGDSNGIVRIWSLADRKEIVTKDIDSNGVTHIAISPDGKEIATIAYDSEVAVWNAADMAPLKKFKVDTNSLNRIEYLAPNMLAAAGENTTLWNTTTGALVRELSPGRYSRALARSADGSRFIFGGDESLHIWNVADDKEEAVINHGVSGSERIAFSPDSKFLATASGNAVIIWNIAERRAVQVIDCVGWATVDLSWLPETNLLAVASDVGVTRLWGTPSQGEAVGLKPLHAPVAMPAPDAKCPATIAQMEQAIDFRTFPQIPDSEPTIGGPRDYSAVTAVTPDEAKTFYSYFLKQAGWKPAAVPSTNPTSLEFRKDGFMISASFYDAGDGKTNVSLHHAGNYDVRWTPKFDGAPTEPSYDSEYSLSYRTKAPLLDVETALLRKLHAAGWTPYTRLNSSHTDNPDQRDLEFLNNGATLRVSIGKFPAAPESYTIQYSFFPVDTSAPVPPDAGYVEFDGSTEPELIALTKMTLEEARDFYDRELTAQGWLVRHPDQPFKDDHGWLTYLRNQSNMTIGLTKQPDGRTLVRIGDASGSLWDLSQAKEEPTDKADATGLEAADFPILNESKTAKYDPIGKTIELQIDSSTLAVAAAKYVEALSALGWALEDGGIRDEEYTLMTFTKDDKEISLRARPQDGAAMVSFSGDDLLWTKELPGGKQVVPYETWLRLNKRPPGLDALDQYEAEMRALSAP